MCFWDDTTISPECVFCSHEVTKDHLFFSCPFSSQIWTNVASLTCKTPLSSWELLIKWGEGLKRKSHRNTIYKLAWQSNVYTIWLERNARFHSQTASDPTTLTELIMYNLKLRLLSFPSSSILTILTTDWSLLWRAYSHDLLGLNILLLPISFVASLGGRSVFWMGFSLDIMILLIFDQALEILLMNSLGWDCYISKSLLFVCLFAVHICGLLPIGERYVTF